MACVAFVAANSPGLSLSPLEPVSFLDFIRPNVWNAPVNVFLLFYLARYSGPLARALSSRLAVAGGDIGYSIYLLHLFILVRFQFVERPLSLAGGLEAVCRIGIYLLITMSAAYGTYQLIETPARRWIRSVFETRYLVSAR